MKVDRFAVWYQHSLFLVVTFLSMGMCESLTAQSHQAHAHTRLMDTSKKITPLQPPTWHKIARVNMNPFNGFMFSFSINFKVCWQISCLVTHTHTHPCQSVLARRSLTCGTHFTSGPACWLLEPGAGRRLHGCTLYSSRHCVSPDLGSPGRWPSRPHRSLQCSWSLSQFLVPATSLSYLKFASLKTCPLTYTTENLIRRWDRLQ